MEVIDTIDLNVPGASSLVLRDLSEYVTLPFLAAFDIPEPKPSSVPARSAQLRMGPKQVTYIGLSKKVMPMLVDLFAKYKDLVAIYVDGTLEAVLSVSARDNTSVDALMIDSVAGVFHTYQAQIRLSTRIKVWERSTAMEDRNNMFPADRQRTLTPNQCSKFR